MSQIEPDLVVKFTDTTLTIAGGKATIVSPPIYVNAGKEIFYRSECIFNDGCLFFIGRALEKFGILHFTKKLITKCGQVYRSGRWIHQFFQKAIGNPLIGQKLRKKIVGVINSHSRRLSKRTPISWLSRDRSATRNERRAQ